ncbi:hypothetical protein GA0070560_105116 [Micromonospora halophytica]|uniref:Uncharacterized protein n=2 Tax=Micromonospora halophytica TaxID=47864 RepID=A0A1C5HN57_9ACTN|nr:hypothetical protein GA0070560_105116 [Micromonospora halophytica]
MLPMPAARRHHRSRTGYAFGLMALVGAALTLVVVVRYPAESATRLAEPVPAPEITVVEAPAGDGNLGEPGDPDDWSLPAGAGRGLDAGTETGAAGDPPSGTDPTTGTGPGAGGGEGALAGAPAGRSSTDQRQALSQSLFWSGLLGLAISLAGLGLVGTRRRMW